MRSILSCVWRFKLFACFIENDYLIVNIINYLGGRTMKEIPGYKGYYITKDGRVFSKKSNNRKDESTPKELKLQKDKDGYMVIGLYGEKHRKLRKVHQLILETYKGQRPAGLVTRHLNGDNTKNDLDNLLYGTQSENEKDKFIHGNIIHNRKLNYFQVRIIRHLKNKIGSRRIAKIFNVGQSTILRVQNNIYYQEV